MPVPPQRITGRSGVITGALLSTEISVAQLGGLIQELFRSLPTWVVVLGAEKLEFTDLIVVKTKYQEGFAFQFLLNSAILNASPSR